MQVYENTYTMCIIIIIYNELLFQTAQIFGIRMSEHSCCQRQSPILSLKDTLAGFWCNTVSYWKFGVIRIRSTWEIKLSFHSES